MQKFLHLPLDYRIRWDYIAIKEGGKSGTSTHLPTLERKIMTEALQKDYEKTCAERINEQWKLRQEDLQYPEFEGLGFDYVEPHTFTDQLEGYWRWQFSWGGPSDELRAFVNENKEIHRLEYWFMDWMDGAKLELQPGPEWDQMQEMVHCAS